MSKPDPHAEVLKLLRSIQNMRYRHKTKLRKLENEMRQRHTTDLHLIAQMVGEGLPRERIRNEIIRLAAK